jgi:serine protein kinase
MTKLKEVLMDILRKMEEHREEEQRLKWEGTFAEYLDILKEP